MIGSRSGCDFKASVRSLTSKEDGLIGLEGGTLGAYLSLLTEESSAVFLETLTFHVGRHDAILHILELLADRVTWVDLALVTSIEELAGCCLVL